MITLKKLAVIAKAKFSDKSNLGDWYQKRLDICGQCPFNSENKEDLSVRDKAVVGMNLGKASCLACTCDINAKASVRDEDCGLTKINRVPLWTALPDVQVVEFSDFHIENLSADKVKMTLKENIILDYGVIKHNSKSTFEISIKDKENLITRLNATSACSCTVPTPRKKGDTYFISIEYNTSILGRINKVVTFRIERNKQQQVIKANIIGTVVK